MKKTNNISLIPVVAGFVIFHLLGVITALCITHVFRNDITPTGTAAPDTVTEAQVPVISRADPTEEPYHAPTLADEIFRLTNKERAINGIGELAYCDALSDAAELRAYESSVSFSHTRPDGSSCHSVASEIDYYVTGENLIMADAAIAYPEVLMSKWMLSEGHRANILNPDYKELAVGTYEDGGIVYAAQIFIG